MSRRTKRIGEDKFCCICGNEGHYYYERLSCLQAKRERELREQ